MKKIFLILVSLIVISIASDSQTAHLIFFGNTLDNKIGSSVAITERFYFNEFSPAIKQYANMSVKEYCYVGTKFTVSNVKSVMSSLSTNYNDVIIFIADGHGNNSSGNYPSVQFLDYSYDLIDIYNTLKGKPHKLLIVLAEACNNNSTSSSGISSSGSGNSVNNYSANSFAFTNLFKNTQYDIIASSSSKGQYSWSYHDSFSFFIIGFKTAFYRITNNNYTGTVSWSNFFYEVKKEVTNIANKEGKNQTVQYSIEENNNTIYIPPVYNPNQNSTNQQIYNNKHKDNRPNKNLIPD